VGAAAEDAGGEVIVTLPALAVAGVAIGTPWREVAVDAVRLAGTAARAARAVAIQAAMVGADLAVATLRVGVAVVAAVAVAIAVGKLAGVVVIAAVARLPRIVVEPGAVAFAPLPALVPICHLVAPWWGNPDVRARRVDMAHRARRTSVAPGRIRLPRQPATRSHLAGRRASCRGAGGIS